MEGGCDNSEKSLRFVLTGNTAYNRIRKLLPEGWIDCTKSVNLCNDEGNCKIDFLWENTPRLSSREYRNSVKCYSHLPNGIFILDDKWCLARLLGEKNVLERDENDFTVLETHCARGRTGIARIFNDLGILESNTNDESSFKDLILPDLSPLEYPRNITPSPSNNWLIKDTASNGAGGIWFVSGCNASMYIDEENSPLIEEHRYVVQRYTWPPVLFQKRKCHVRVYSLFTSDGNAYVHNRAFLHVANDVFTIENQRDFKHSVHVSNCCANSDDKTKFYGEICAYLFENVYKRDYEFSLTHFSDSICSSVAALATKSFPFLRGGEGNNGFEYLGLDFILSYKENYIPVAYLLEVNAPPSLDSATGLKHAEELHDDVLRDLLTVWVFPKVMNTDSQHGGWKSVFSKSELEKNEQNTRMNQILPSKASLLNKIRWKIWERKHLESKRPQCRLLEEDEKIISFSRNQFPYFQNKNHFIFFENAGGTQVPQIVIQNVLKSMSHRHREKIGKRDYEFACYTLLTILGAGDSSIHSLFFGLNSSSLLQNLTLSFAFSKLDEIIIAEHNHEANITPWLRMNAKIIWWKSSSLVDLQHLLTSKTRIVACSHASNIYGYLYDIQKICATVHSMSNAKVVVDGVAASPHRFANIQETNVDFYVLSCHKLFGPHLGVLCAKNEALDQFQNNKSLLEVGTISYEACAGVHALGYYLRNLATLQKTLYESPHYQSSYQSTQETQYLTQDSFFKSDHVKEAYRRIQLVELKLVQMLLNYFRSNPNIFILEDKFSSQLHTDTFYSNRLPIVSILHKNISPSFIVNHCYEKGIICRNGYFLSKRIIQNYCQMLQSDNIKEKQEGVVRFSLVHYNTPDEINKLKDILSAINGW